MHIYIYKLIHLYYIKICRYSYICLNAVTSFWCVKQIGMKNLLDLSCLWAVEALFEIITFNHPHVQTENSMRGACECPSKLVPDTE